MNIELTDIQMLNMDFRWDNLNEFQTNQLISEWSNLNTKYLMNEFGSVGTVNTS